MGRAHGSPGTGEHSGGHDGYVARSESGGVACDGSDYDNCKKCGKRHC